MPPGTEEATTNALSTGGWPAWATLIVLLGGFAFIALAIRQLWNDHRELNAWVRDDMTTVLSSLTMAFGRWARTRPCLHDSDVILDQIISEEEDEEELDEFELKAKRYLQKVMERRRDRLVQARLREAEQQQTMEATDD